jgi:outer membrane receptor protein involved in Fe transport
MLKSMTFRSLLAAVACAISFSAHAIADPKQFDVPGGALIPALESFAKQAGVELGYQPEQIKGFSTKGVKGKYEPEAAVRLLLKGTPLELRTDPSGAMVIAAPITQSSSTGAGAAAAAESSRSNPTPEGAKEKSSPDPFRVAQSNQGTDSGAAQVSGSTARLTQNEKNPQTLEEVIVTAQKREERLQDVPVPVTVLNADALTEVAQFSLRDYFSSVPGLNVTPNPYGALQATIRGLTSGTFANPTVGVTVDDVPFGPSSSLAWGENVPDVDPGNLARIEVLRGPQGTLYGASSMGGLIKYITVAPSTDGVNGHIELGTSSIYNAANLGYNARGAVNFPLGNTFAVRVSGFTHEEPGYIDNIVSGQQGVNKTKGDGGTLAALWRASDGLTVKATALVQHSTSAGSASVNPALGDLKQDKSAGVGAYDNTLQAYSLVLAAKLGAVDLISVTAYNINRNTNSADLTNDLGAITENGIPGTGFSGFGVTGTPLVNYVNTGKFSQELRLSGAIGARADWLLGGFYDYEDTSYYQDILASVPETGEVVGQSLHLVLPSTYSESAVFGDLTYHFTDRLSVQFGGRYAKNKQTYQQTFVGPLVEGFFGVPSPLVYPKAYSDGDAFTYLFTPQLRLSSNAMLYTRLASGYRPGGPNISPTGRGIPPEYEADKTSTYEIGFKGDMLNHALSLDASLYYIDWKDIQIDATDEKTQLSYRANGSRAKSQGIEFSMDSHPITGMKLAAWVAWNTAVLTEPMPPTSQIIGQPGDRLPLSARFSASASVDQEFHVVKSAMGFVGASVGYVGERLDVFNPPLPPPQPPRGVFPAYAETDLRAGLRMESWNITLFANNVADKRGILVGDPHSEGSGVVYIQPRTIGLSVVKKF